VSTLFKAQVYRAIRAAALAAAPVFVMHLVRAVIARRGGAHLSRNARA
jgi:hypothetical protein